MDIYEFIDICRENGLTAVEAENEWSHELEEGSEAFREAYESDPWVWEGWAQQDLIDMYRREK